MDECIYNIIIRRSIRMYAREKQNEKNKWVLKVVCMSWTEGTFFFGLIYSCTQFNLNKLDEKYLRFS